MRQAELQRQAEAQTEACISQHQPTLQDDAEEKRRKRREALKLSLEKDAEEIRQQKLQETLKQSAKMMQAARVMQRSKDATAAEIVEQMKRMPENKIPFVRPKALENQEVICAQFGL